MADNSDIVGEVIDGRYLILELIGAGGMGTVYKARQIGLERLVAIKLLHTGLITNVDRRSRFKREGKIISGLVHEHIITFYSFGVWKKRYPYIAMEYLEGTSLRDVLVREGRLGLERAVKIGLQICDAMEYSVQNSVINRDLNPNNIMLVTGAETDFVKIIDFGLAKLVADGNDDQKLTQTGALMGTIPYLSPEQCQGLLADHRSDIYALGCLLYECIAGQLPIQADNPIGVLHKHVHEMPLSLKECLPNESLPSGLDAVLFKAMAKNPDERYQSMREFAHDLKLVLENKGDSVSAKPVQWENRTGVSQKKKISERSLFAFSLSILLLLVAAAIAFLLSDPGPVSLLAGHLRDRDFPESFELSARYGEWCLGHARPNGAKIFLLQAYQIGKERGLKSLEQAILESQLAKLCLVDDEVHQAQDLCQDALAIILQLKLDESDSPRHEEENAVMRSSLDILVQSGLQSSASMRKMISNLSAYYWQNKDQANVYVLAMTGLKLELRRFAAKSRNPDLAGAYKRLRGAYNIAGNFKQSEWCSKKEIEILSRGAGSKSELCDTWCGLGETYVNEGRLVEAEQCYRKAFALVSEADEKNIFDYIDVRRKLAKLLIDEKRQPEAKLLLKELLDVAQRSTEISEHSRAMLYGDSGWISYDLGLDSEVVKAWSKALETYSKNAPGSNARYAMTAGWLSDFYLEKKHYEEALVWCRKALAALKKEHQSIDLDIIRQESRIIRILTAAGRLSEAKDVLAEVTRLEERLPVNFAELDIYSDLRTAYEKLGDKNMAELYRRKASQAKR